jgi:membrane carboxypeptidase/penicillin-binding protein
MARVSRRLPPGQLQEDLASMGMLTSSLYERTVTPAQFQPATNRTEAAIQAVGEWGIAVSPLALLAGYSSLARELSSEGVNRSAELILAGLQGCATYGTGGLAAVNALDLAGKTGTSTSQDRSHYHGWFMSFAPARKPRLVCAVYVENATGGNDAAPVAGQLWRVLKEELVV